MAVDLSNLVIRTDVPLPPVHGTTQLQMKEVLSKLQVGHSFTVSKKGRETWQKCAKQLGIKLAVRKNGDEITIWRVA